MSENPYCGACGAPVAPADTFCTGCGAPLAAPAPATALPNERTLAVIGNLTRVGGFMGFGSKTYSLVLTDRRIIFAELTKERITSMVNEARETAKEQGKGFMGQWGAQLGTSFAYHEVYWQMAPDAVLAETPDNFAIDRSEFMGAKFKTGVMYDDGRNTPDELILKWAGGKHKLTVNGSLPAAKDAFRQAGLA